MGVPQILMFEPFRVDIADERHREIGGSLEAGYGRQAREIASELAVHFLRGRDAPRAVPYLGNAGENALQRSAYQEAVAHLTKGLEVLGTLPDTVERARQEVDLQTTLGVAFMGAKGYGAAEVGTACARARALCEQMGEAPQLTSVVATEPGSVDTRQSCPCSMVV